MSANVRSGLIYPRKRGRAQHIPGDLDMKRLLLVSILGALHFGVSPVSAQTVGFADAITILTKSCGDDIDALCRSATLANNGIGQCLNQNSAKVSQQCNRDRAVVQRLIAERLAAQAAAPKICENDVRQYCGSSVRSGGRALRCLLKAKRVVSKKCNTAIDLAGFR